MAMLIAGLIIWVGVHCVPMMVEVRAGLISRFGELPYKGLFALVSLLGLGLIIWGKSNAELIEVWAPFAWGRYVTMMLMLPAVVLLVAAYGPDNTVRRYLGHPMILGVELWALAHLLANGDLASMILFGSFFIWTVFAFASASRRKPPRGGQAKMVNNAVVLILGLVIYIGIFRGHEWIAGVSLAAG